MTIGKGVSFSGIEKPVAERLPVVLKDVGRGGVVRYSGSVI